jgi:hypothetical protein
MVWIRNTGFLALLLGLYSMHANCNNVIRTIYFTTVFIYTDTGIHLTRQIKSEHNAEGRSILTSQNYDAVRQTLAGAVETPCDYLYGDPRSNPGRNIPSTIV